MPVDSFKKLLAKFPYFLDKNVGSNFNTSEHIFHNQFQELYNNLFQVYLAGKIDKHVLIWKNQEEPYDYDINFVVHLPHLKEVFVVKIYDRTIEGSPELEDGEEIIPASLSTVEEIEEVIYTESYGYDDNIDSFYYIYKGSSETPIPTDKFKIIASTFEENTIVKGFPENDLILHNEYDHDISLDDFGEFIDLPRRQYIKTEDYSRTEPKYNDRLSEDDYHYMNRILFYLQHLQDVPLVILEVWKHLGLDINNIQLLNRERLLCKMFETSRHTTNGNYNQYWNPKRGEHKDKWCVNKENGMYLFADVNNSTPVQLQDFKFNFRILDDFGRDVFNNLTEEYDVMSDGIITESKNPFYIIPFINNQMIDVVIKSNESWTLNTSQINHEDAKFIFKCFSTIDEVNNEILVNEGIFQIFENDIISDEILISVKGCNSADWYVNPLGDNTNSGKSKNEPFKTLEKALEMVEGSKNVIALSNDIHELSKPQIIHNNTKIISCPNYSPTIIADSDLFFQISQNTSLYIQNVNLKHSLYSTNIDDTTFSNNNHDKSHLNVILEMFEIVALDSDENVDIIFTDDTTVCDDGILISSEEGESKWNITITSDEISNENILVFEDSDNPNLIIKDRDDKDEG